MPGLFSNYKAVVLDASFFAVEFSELMQQELAQANIFVAETFNAEVAQYIEIVTAERGATYQKNIAFLQQNKPLRTVSFGEYGRNLHNDTFGVATVMTKANIKTVLVTADKLLVQRVALSGIPIDIYDLTRNTFIYAIGFSTYSSYFALQQETEWAGIQHQAQAVGPNTVLYRKNGSSITLGKEIRSGLEAHLFMLKDDSALIAKIFKQDRLPADKFKNILKIQGSNKQLDIDWALFPIDVVYYDAKCTKPAGFTEGFAKTTVNLDDNPLYLGEVNLPDSYLKSQLSDTIKLCLKVVRQVRYLSSYGFMICDFNMGNFALRDASSTNVQMWDTDSFGYDSYFSGYCSGSRTSREYDIRIKKGAIDFCAEALYLFAFTLLSLGDAPISEFSGKFKYDNPKYNGRFRKDLFPDNLWKLFETVFRGEKEPSAEMLLFTLHTTLQDLQSASFADKTYKELLAPVLVASEKTGSISTTNGIQHSVPQNNTSNGNQPKQISNTANSGNQYSYSGSGYTDPETSMPGWLKFLLICGGIILFLYILAQL